MKPSDGLLAEVRRVAALHVEAADDRARGVAAHLALEASKLGASGRAALGQAFIEGMVLALLPKPEEAEPERAP